MTILEGLREAAIRDGDPPELVDDILKLACSRHLPGKMNDQIPAGTEERFIVRQLAIKRRNRFLRQTCPQYRARMDEKQKVLQQTN